MATVSRRYAVTKLLGSEPLVYVRAQTITCTYDDARPNTVLNVFVEGIKYNHRVEPRDWANSGYKAQGNPVIVSASGRVEFKIHLEAGKFRAGDVHIVATEASELSELEINGNTLGQLSADFIAQGTLQVFRTTVSLLDVDLVQPPPPPRTTDPLAQSFFTYGKVGGVYVTSIDLYFYTKDSTFPVSVDIREMTNGYPTQKLVSADAVVTKYPAAINVSNDATSVTNFEFPVPIYLEQDREYCFVVKANCNTYQLWAQKMGEKSNETKKTIFEQPYIGSLFKSQNESTWTTDQFEDMKFRMHVADFTAQSGSITLGGDAATRWTRGAQFTTTTGSNKVLFTANEQHGFTMAGGERISVSPISLASGASYNGIPAADISGNFSVTRVLDNYTVEFEIGATATSSGHINSSNVITHIGFENQNADSPIPTQLIIPAPHQVGGTQATAIVNVAVGFGFQAGTFVGANMTNHGSGYTSNVTVDAGTWPGNVIGYNEAWFNVSMNKPISLFVPNIAVSIPAGSKIEAKHRLVDTAYQEREFPTDLYAANFALTEQILANHATSAYKGMTEQSFKIDLDLTTSRSNLSPAVDLRRGATVTSYANAINDQGFSDDVTSLLATSGVISLTKTLGGSGYSSVPAVTIMPADDEPNLENIVHATAICTTSGGAVNTISIQTAGSGYTRAPTVHIAPPSSGTQATAVAKINPVNSELLPNNGYALARYITKEIKLEVPSTGIKVLSFLASTPDTTVDWYVRTSMTSDATVHSDLGWTRLKCDVARNRSTSFGELFDYEFYIYDLPEFDTYNLKCVMSQNYQNMTPIIKNYRVITVV